MVQGPLVTDLRRTLRSVRPRLENGAITGANPATVHRLSLWKQAQVRVLGRPAMVGGASDRKETLHFVSAREMANILLAACDGREGNPGDYRDYRFKRMAEMPLSAEKSGAVPVSMKL